MARSSSDNSTTPPIRRANCKNDISGGEFLHGFANNTETPGSTFLTVTAVPEPTAVLLGLVGMAVVATTCGRRGRSAL